MTTPQVPPIAPMLERGDPLPWFRAPALGGRSDYAFDTVAGRHVLLLFFESAGQPEAASALALVNEGREAFDDCRACFFGVSCDRADVDRGRIAQSLPGIRFLLDFDRRLSVRFGAQGGDGYRPHWLLLDPALRVAERFALDQGRQALDALGSAVASPVSAGFAPVLEVPDLFPADLLERLIALYVRSGGEQSGFMRDVDGKTVRLFDPHHKQRRDAEIESGSLRRALCALIERRLCPQVRRAFQFNPTRIERHIVACYEEGAGHFRPHRDNTTSGTAHRRFAVTVNLNGDYDGGDLRFPEFGGRLYRAPPGGAVVFSCSLLHEATPVTRGRRYAYLPFLYDEAAARQRAANNDRLGDGVAAYDG